jgi:hypothetical protein
MTLHKAARIFVRSLSGLKLHAVYSWDITWIHLAGCVEQQNGISVSIKCGKERNQLSS